MKIFLHHKDILDVTEADTIVVPVDGSGPNMEGAIARQLMRRVEVDEMDDIYIPPPDYPFNGRCHWSHIEGDFEQTHFKHMCAIGVLSHLPDVNHAAIIRSAIFDLFESAGGDRGTKLACPVIRAGWRLDPIQALCIMLDAATHFRDKDLELHIAERDPDKYKAFRPYIGEDPADHSA